MKRILIVEDQADIRKLLQLTLEFERHEVHEAHDGAQGLERAQALQPDLVLLDVMMPGEIDGLTLCRRLKDQPRPPLVVLLTARGQAADIEAGRQAGADDYLVKPFSPLQLIDTIGRLTAAA